MSNKKEGIVNTAGEEANESDIVYEDDDEMDAEIDDSAIQTNIILETDLKISEGGMARMKIESSTETTRRPGDDTTDQSSDVEVIVEARQNGEGNITAAHASENVPWVVDLHGDPSLAARTVKRHVAQRPPSSPSDSNDEVVIFNGRNAQGQPLRKAGGRGGQPQSRQPSRPRNDRTSSNQTDDVRSTFTVSATPSNSHYSLVSELASNSTPRFSSQVGGWASKTSKYDQKNESPSDWTPAPSYPYWRKRKDNYASNLGTSSSKMKAIEHVSNVEPKEDLVGSSPAEEEEAGAEQTISSLRADWRETLRARRQEKKNGKPLPDEGSTSKAKPSRRHGKRGRKKSNRQMRDDGVSDDDDIDDGESAYIDYMENLRAQVDADGSITAEEMARSVLVNGPSLVVDGKEIAEDETLPREKKAMGNENDITMESDHSSDWESEMNPDSDELSSEESLNASDLEDELEYTERQQWEDEADLRQRRIDRMRDEHMARLLTKQEELGIRGDEIVIDDGAEMSTSDGIGDVHAARAALANLTNLPSGRRSNRHNMRTRSSNRDFAFPDASALADTVDQYGGYGFDIMDFDRPSLRQPKKGRKSKLPPDLEYLSDEELKSTLGETWERDRLTKRQKKIQREELRVQGLLGSAGKKGTANLNQKYPNGMSMDHIQDELKAFLLDQNMAQRAFPPMDKRDRKALHEIAVALNLISKSQGAGKKRFPILYKSSRTPDYSDNVFQQVMVASSHGALANRGRAGKIAKSTAKNNKVGGGGGFSKAAATLRNGEIVGAGAAEIGKENFGHKLMEKMGWTKGQALGKDGEGLLVPVEQRMRVGTAGLG